MTKSELQKLIRQEVVGIVKSELPKLVKPLVQEAVAGALANLLAEGIVKGPPTSPKILSPAVPRSRAINNRPDKTAGQLDPVARRSLASKLGYDNIDPIGVPNSTGNLTQDILAETAYDMSSGGVHVESILDAAGSLEGVVDPEAVDAITRDYSELMAAMNRRGKLNG